MSDAAVATMDRLQALVYETAREHPRIGEIAQSVKWGQPSYAPARPNIGSSVRIATDRQGRPALFFICHTGLVDRFRELYPETLAFDGNRALVFEPGQPLPEAEIKHCIAMALTYKLDKRGR